MVKVVSINHMIKQVKKIHAASANGKQDETLRLLSELKGDLNKDFLELRENMKYYDNRLDEAIKRAREGQRFIKEYDRTIDNLKESLRGIRHTCKKLAAFF